MQKFSIDGSLQFKLKLMKMTTKISHYFAVTGLRVQAVLKCIEIYHIYHQINFK
jgi:hypothetical protein